MDADIVTEEQYDVLILPLSSYSSLFLYCDKETRVRRYIVLYMYIKL